MPRARPRQAQGDGPQQEQFGLQTLLGLLPILLFFIIPLITSIFSGGSSTPATPRMVFDDPKAPFTEGRTTPNLNVKYFVIPSDVASYSKSKLTQLDRTAEIQLVRQLRYECENEVMHKRQLRENAMGWFYQDPEKMAAADAYKMPACSRLETLGVSRS